MNMLPNFVDNLIKKTKNDQLGLVKNIFILSFSLGSSLLFIELFLTKVGYPYQECKQTFQSAEYYLGNFDPQTGWSYKSNISYYEEAGDYEYHFDENGIRTRTPNYDVNFEKPRIVFVGDSVTFGEELNYNDTFPSQINHLLEDKFEIINLGVQGYGTDQALLRLEKYIEDFSPEYVIYTFIVDDKNRNINYDRRLHFKCLEFAGTKPLFALSNGNIKQVLFPKKYEKVDRFKLPLFLSHSKQNLVEQLDMKYGQDIDLTKALIQEIENTSKHHHAKDFYIYFDTTYDLSENSQNNYLSKRIFSQDQLDRTLMFVNWAEDSSEKGLKYFVNSDDDIHPNASLSAVLAKKFVEKFGAQFY